MKISVAMAYYNGGTYIEEQMDSILSQLEYLLKEQNIEIEKKDFENSVKIHIKASKDEFEELKALLPREIKIL